MELELSDKKDDSQVKISNEQQEISGYIGDSTRSEIEYAIAHGKNVRYLED